MTDYAKMTTDDLIDVLLGDDIGKFQIHDDIRAEIARRIAVRDRVVRQFMEDGAWDTINFDYGVSVHTDDDYNPTYFDKQGEQIL